MKISSTPTRSAFRWKKLANCARSMRNSKNVQARSILCACKYKDSKSKNGTHTHLIAQMSWSICKHCSTFYAPTIFVLQPFKNVHAWRWLMKTPSSAIASRMSQRNSSSSFPTPRPSFGNTKAWLVVMSADSCSATPSTISWRVASVRCRYSPYVSVVDKNLHFLVGISSLVLLFSQHFEDRVSAADLWKSCRCIPFVGAR